MASLKFDLEIGALKLSYDGSEEFVEGKLSAFIERIAQLDMPNMVVQPQEGAVSLQSIATDQPAAVASRLSTTDFAVKLGVKSGTDLVVAAAAYLHLTRGLGEFKRSDLLAEMKTAKSFFKSSYSGNLTKSLDTLTKAGRLLNPKLETYALSHAQSESMSMLL